MKQVIHTISNTRAGVRAYLFGGFRRALLGGLCLFSALCASPGAATEAAAQGADAVQTWAIPAGPLSEALTRFATEAGLYLAGASEQAEGKVSPGLNGRYPTRQALTRLLAGSGLAYRFVDASTVTLEPEEEEPEMLPPLTVEGIPESVRFWLSDLPEVYEGGQVGSGGRVGLLGNLDVFDTPFSVTNYTSELIENQQAKTVSDVIRNDSSARSASPNQSYRGIIQMRGFNFGHFNALYNGLPGLEYSNVLSVQTLERVQVFKGPNALLNGVVDNVGGTINRVSKRPVETSLTRITADYDYQSRLGIHADLSQRFGSEKQFGARLNVIYRDGEEATEDRKEKFGEAALALEYRGDRLKLETILDYFHRDLDRSNQAITLSRNATSFPSAPDLEDNIQQPWERQDREFARALIKAEYDLSKDWTVHAAYGALDYEEYRLRTLSFNLKANGDFGVWAQPASVQVRNLTWNAGVRGNLKLLGTTHQVSVETVRAEKKLYFDFKNIPTGIVSNLYNPVFTVFPKIDSPIRRARPPKSRYVVYSSTAIADTIGFFDDRVLLTAGIRRQDILQEIFNLNTGARNSKYEKSANTPAFALLVKPWSFMSLYGNYIEALETGPTAPNSAVNAGEQLPPSETEQVEFGVKFDLDGLGLTAGVFQIEKPSAFTDANNRFGLNGEQRNRGLELNAFGELRPNLRLLGGVTYIDSELTRTQGGKFDGNNPIGVPELTAVLNLEWDAPVLPGLTLTARAEHTGRLFVNTENTLRIPSYELYGIGARYKRMMGDQQFTFRVNIDNLFNKNHWLNSGKFSYLGMPRSINLSFSMDF